MKPLIEAASTEPNLSEAILGSLEREPRDQIRCVRVYDDYYRCNWWTPVVAKDVQMPRLPWEIAAAYRIRKSVLMHARMVDGKLVMRVKV